MSHLPKKDSPLTTYYSRSQLLWWASFCSRSSLCGVHFRKWDIPSIWRTEIDFWVKSIRKETSRQKKIMKWEEAPQLLQCSFWPPVVLSLWDFGNQNGEYICPISPIKRSNRGDISGNMSEIHTFCPNWCHNSTHKKWWIKTKVWNTNCLLDSSEWTERTCFIKHSLTGFMSVLSVTCIYWHVSFHEIFSKTF